MACGSLVTSNLDGINWNGNLGLEILSPKIILQVNYFEFLVDRLEFFLASLEFLKMEFWKTEAAIVTTMSRRFKRFVPGFWGPKFPYFQSIFRF